MKTVVFLMSLLLPLLSGQGKRFPVYEDTDMTSLQHPCLHERWGIDEAYL